MTAASLHPRLQEMYATHSNDEFQTEIATLRDAIVQYEVDVKRLTHEIAVAEDAVQKRGEPRRHLEAELAEAKEQLNPIVVQKSELKTKIIDIQHDTVGHATVEAALQRQRDVEATWLAAKECAVALSDDRDLSKVKHDIRLAELHVKETDKESLLYVLWSLSTSGKTETISVAACLNRG